MRVKRIVADYFEPPPVNYLTFRAVVGIKACCLLIGMLLTFVDSLIKD
jgi:hypothetical protein